MVKQIYFYPLNNSENKKVIHGYYEVLEALKSGVSKIHTTSMMNFSFSCIEGYGYQIFLVGMDGRTTEIKYGMPEIDRELRAAHNIRKMFGAGVFDHLIF